MPGSILSLAGGGLFGPVWGKAYALLGATVGATLVFLAARYLASDWVVATAGGRLKQLAEGVEAEGWRFIAFVRLVALFPFNLVNYGLGLTRVRLLDYSLASPSPWHPARSPTPASAVPAAKRSRAGRPWCRRA